MSRIIKCDRCGGEVEPKRIGYISMMERKEEDGSLTGTNPFEQMDFCGKCMDLIAGFITNEGVERTKSKTARGGAKPKAGTAVEPKKKGGRPPLDAGKIRALAAAGWDPDKIADEMGCSVPTVAKYLKEVKEC